jgi:hypothetical protein
VPTLAAGASGTKSSAWLDLDIEISIGKVGSFKTGDRAIDGKDLQRKWLHHNLRQESQGQE